MSEVTKKLKKYKCHKVVEAFLITEAFSSETTHKVLLQGDGIEIMVADDFYYRSDIVGGYYIRYKDGYESWSPKEAFEDSYTVIDE